MARTTMALDDRVIARLRARARREGRHVQDLANDLLRRGLEEGERGARGRGAKLPALSMGKALVDVADRDALEDAMGGDER